MSDKESDSEKTVQLSQDDADKLQSGVFSLKHNIIQPFMLESTNLRGRYVNLSTCVDEIIDAHQYPRPVAHLVAETLTLALLLSSMLKYEGIFTLQTKGDGPVSMLAADVTSDGNVRACASFDDERLEKAREQLSALKSEETAQNHLAQYLGKGYIAFTVDQGGDTERYQGIVELKGSSLIDCVQHYFSQSEQIHTGIKMAVGERDGKWRAAGLMLQDLPEEGGKQREINSNMDEDDWRRAMILMDSCTNDEFLNPDLSPNDILFRLFHEEGVRVFEPVSIQKKCRCDKDRVETILLSMDSEEVKYISKNGEISMHCEFCGEDYIFQTSDILKKTKQKQNRD